MRPPPDPSYPPSPARRIRPDRRDPLLTGKRPRSCALHTRRRPRCPRWSAGRPRGAPASRLLTPGSSRARLPLCRTPSVSSANDAPLLRVLHPHPSARRACPAALSLQSPLGPDQPGRKVRSCKERVPIRRVWGGLSHQKPFTLLQSPSFSPFDVDNILGKKKPRGDLTVVPCPPPSPLVSFSGGLSFVIAPLNG